MKQTQAVKLSSLCFKKPLRSHEKIKSLWKQLKRTKEQIGIAAKPTVVARLLKFRNYPRWASETTTEFNPDTIAASTEFPQAVPIRSLPKAAVQDFLGLSYEGRIEKA